MRDIEMRKQYAQTLLELYQKDQRVYCLEADLSSSMSTASLQKEMGSNYINVGIMEANMIGVAAGINLTGGVCFVHSFGQFITRRALDQVFVSLAYAKLHCVLVGSDAGVSAEHNGGTHMTFEDLGIMRTIPNVNIYDVSDPVQLEYVLKKAYENPGVHYIRTIRKKAIGLYEDQTTFESAPILREGKDISLVACGICVSEALKAAEQLSKEGIECEVIDAFQIQPLDKETLLTSFKKTNKVITIENHNIQNGLGSAVAELIGEEYPILMKRMGVKNSFGQVGTMDYLQEFYQIDETSIVKTVKEFISK